VGAQADPPGVTVRNLAFFRANFGAQDGEKMEIL
jgi:hypothetical protein